MATEKINIDLTVSAGGATKSLKELKQEIRELTSASLQAKEGSKEQLAALQKLAMAKEQLKDLREVVNGLSPDAKAASFARLGSTIAGGFQAATGAAALFGAESEDLQKTLLKVQAATALAQGIQSMVDFGKQIKIVGKIIQTAFASNPLGVIITGLLAASAAIAALTQDWWGLTDAEKENKTATDGVFIANEKLKESYDESLTQIKDLQIEYDLLTGAIDETGAAMLRLDIKHQENVKKIKEDTKKQLEETNSTWNNILNGAKAALFGVSTVIQKTAEEKVQIVKDGNNALLKEEEKYNLEKKIQEEKGNQESLKKQKEYNDQQIQLEKDKEDIIYQQKKYYEKLYQEIEAEKLKNRLNTQQIIDANNKYIDDLEAQRLEHAKQRTDTDNEYQKNKAQDLADAKKQIQEDSFSALTSLGIIFINNAKKLEKFNKGLAFTQILIDTAQAISALVKNSEANPGNAITGGLAGIAQFTSGIARILANIAKAKQLLSKAGDTPSVSLSGGGGGGGGFTPSPNGVPVQNNTSTLFNQQGQMLKAYVVESEMTSVQKKVSAIENRARF